MALPILLLAVFSLFLSVPVYASDALRIELTAKADPAPMILRSDENGTFANAVMSTSADVAEIKLQGFKGVTKLLWRPEAFVLVTSDSFPMEWAYLSESAHPLADWVEVPRVEVPVGGDRVSFDFSQRKSSYAGVYSTVGETVDKNAPFPPFSSSSLQGFLLLQAEKEKWDPTRIDRWLSRVSQCASAYEHPCGVYQGIDRFRVVGDGQTLAEFTVNRPFGCCGGWPCRNFLREKPQLVYYWPGESPWRF